MTKCIYCKYAQYAQVYDFTLDENIDMVYCNAFDDYIEREVADNDNIRCDAYVEDMVDGDQA